jgi:hypothetical protein
MTEHATPPAAATHGRIEHPVVGVVPPTLGEARIREAWPSLSAVSPLFAVPGWKMVRTYILAPVGWVLLLLAFLRKFAPFVCARYTLTNRRLMIQRGWKPSPVQEVKLEDIGDVRLDEKGIDNFLVEGTLEVVGKDGKVVMTLTGVPEPAGFKEAILNAVRAWAVPADKVVGPFRSASTK